MASAHSPHEDALQTIRDWWRAWSENDLDAIESMTDPDYAELSDTRSFRQIGSEALSDAPSQYRERIEIESWRIDNAVTRAFQDAITCTYSFEIEGRRHGRPFAYEGYATDVLRRRDQRWTYVSHQTTLVASQRLETGQSTPPQSGSR